MRYSDDYILSRINPSGLLSINTNKTRYMKQSLNEVRSMLDSGTPIHEALDKVNGNYYFTDKRNKKKKFFARSAVALTSVFALVGAGGYLSAQIFSPENVDALTSNGDDVRGTDQDEMILFAGVDRRPEVDQGDGTRFDIPGVRTDVLSLVSIPEDGSRAIGLSLPRDLNVDRPECDIYDPEDARYLTITEPEESNVKINSVYQVGGPRCLVKTIEENFGVSVNRYASVDFESFADVIDALGGVTVEEDAPVVDDVLGEIVPKAGKVTLDGREALQYARARKVEGTDKTDYDRIHRQQKIMSSVIESLRTRENVSDFQFVRSMVQDVLPKMSVDNIGIADAAGILSTVLNMDTGAIRMTTMPVGEELPNGNITADMDEAQLIIDSMNTGTALSGDIPEDVDRDNAFKGVQRSPTGQNFVVVAMNQYDSRAIKAKEDLESQGANVTIVTSSKVPGNSTVIVNDSNANQAATLIGLFPKTLISSDDLGLSLPERTGIVTIGRNSDSALKLHDSVEPGKEVWIPASGTFRSEEIIPRSIPDGPGGHSVVSVE